MGYNADEARFIATMKAYPAIGDMMAPEAFIRIREQMVVTSAGSVSLTLATVPSGKFWVNQGWGGLIVSTTATFVSATLWIAPISYPQKTWEIEHFGFNYLLNEPTLINEGEVIQVGWANCSVDDLVIGYFTGYQITKR